MIRFIVDHPLLYLVISSSPYFAAVFSPNPIDLWIVGVWTIVRILVSVPARRQQLKRVEDRAYADAESELHAIKNHRVSAAR